MLHVRPVRAFADNYIWLIESPHHPERVAAVDPGDAEPVIAELKRFGLQLCAILLTHHHPDHIGGVSALLNLGAVPVIGPDDVRISTLTQAAGDGQSVELPELGLTFETLHIPGHTLSHIAFWGHDSVFCGDTLFSAGCGRMFEGTAQQMSKSLSRLQALPPDTQIFCGHEYTEANLRFALAVEPDNRAALAYQEAVKQLRAKDRPTLPSTIALEVQVNPFLRCDTASVRLAAEQKCGKSLPGIPEVFAVLRAWKDQFR